MSESINVREPATRSILDSELYLGDPHPTYTWLRQNAPIDPAVFQFKVPKGVRVVDQ